MTKLLNDDGTASMATALMMSHHAFRRDLTRFAAAIRAGGFAGDRLAAIREEWAGFHMALHGHHESEETRIFPGIKIDHAELTPAVDQLGEEHRKIDPLLARGDAAFAALPEAGQARVVIDELRALLDSHLAFEERTIGPHLRGFKEFPAPASEDEAAMYAQGFAWSMHGIADSVIEPILAMLAPALRDKIPAARVAFTKRWKRVWGDVTIGASTTSIPA